MLKVMAELKLKHNSWILLFTFWILFSSIRATDVRYCDGEADYAVKVEQVKVFPDPVVRGKPATFNISAVTGQAISGGKVVIDVRFYGVHVHQETRDLCEEISCPVAEGKFVLSHTQTLPSFAPPGYYQLTMKIVAGGGEQLSCITFNFKIRLNSLTYDI